MYPDPESVSYSAPLEQSSDSHVISAFVKTEFLSAPLPPPNIMKGYDDIIPNGAERIMQMAEKEQDSQITERTETRKDNKEIAFKKINLIKRGQYMGYSLAVILMGLATTFVFTGHENVALFLFGIGGVSLVGLFVKSTKEKQ